MKNLYLVTSAIMSATGSPTERFMQTLHTFDSIRSKDPNSEIWLCDSSTASLNKPMLDLMEDIKYIDLSEDVRVHEIKREAKQIDMPVTKEIRSFYENGYIKNMTESYTLNKVLEMIEPGKYNRIFKISGRYFFNINFNLDKRNVFGKINMISKSPSPFEERSIILTGTEYCRGTVTWDYCSSLHFTIVQNYKNIERYLINQFSNRRLGDIEHALTICFDDSIVNDLEEMGVMGRINGESNIYKG
jgi:hypothetical protein